MIYIVKKHEPRELTEYRESESSTGVRPTYDSMSSDLHEYVLSKLVEEQGGLCAYCMCRIPETDKKTGSTLKCTIEHTGLIDFYINTRLAKAAMRNHSGLFTFSFLTAQR